MVKFSQIRNIEFEWWRVLCLEEEQDKDENDELANAFFLFLSQIHSLFETIKIKISKARKQTRFF